MVKVGAKRTFSAIFFFSPLPSTTARPHVTPTRGLTSRAAPSSSPALPATPLARYPVVGGACDKIHAFAPSPPESDTKSARPPNRRPSVGEGTAPAANGDWCWRGADHASVHSSHQCKANTPRPRRKLVIAPPQPGASWLIQACISAFPRTTRYKIPHPTALLVLCEQLATSPIWQAILPGSHRRRDVRA
jgi:hypothetical protein